MTTTTIHPTGIFAIVSVFLFQGDVLRRKQWPVEQSQSKGASSARDRREHRMGRPIVEAQVTSMVPYHHPVLR